MSTPDIVTEAGTHTVHAADARFGVDESIAGGGYSTKPETALDGTQAH